MPQQQRVNTNRNRPSLIKNYHHYHLSNNTQIQLDLRNLQESQFMSRVWRRYPVALSTTVFNRCFSTTSKYNLSFQGIPHNHHSHKMCINIMIHYQLYHPLLEPGPGPVPVRQPLSVEGNNNNNSSYYNVTNHSQSPSNILEQPKKINVSSN